MKKICTHLILILIAFCNIAVLTGCARFVTRSYFSSADNVTTLRALGDNKINVGDFTSSVLHFIELTEVDEMSQTVIGFVDTASYKPGITEIKCRCVGPIKTPDGNTFADFIKEALIDELQIAELYDVGSSVTLNGNLDSIGLSTFFSGEWDIALTVNSSNGESISVSETYSFTSSFVGYTACRRGAKALMPAVQNLIAKLIGNPKFPYLIK